MQSLRSAINMLYKALDRFAKLVTLSSSLSDCVSVCVCGDHFAVASRLINNSKGSSSCWQNKSLNWKGQNKASNLRGNQRKPALYASEAKLIRDDSRWFKGIQAECLSSQAGPSIRTGLCVIRGRYTWPAESRVKHWKSVSIASLKDSKFSVLQQGFSKTANWRWTPCRRPSLCMRYMFRNLRISVPNDPKTFRKRRSGWLAGCNGGWAGDEWGQ